jgi:uncharacterized repeat protein (TIGR02543 family)
MKNRHFWIIALVAIMTFAFVGCGGDESTETFTVTFEANGGTPAPQKQTIEKGGKVTEPPAMTKANSTLDGWYKETAFSNKWNFATDTVTADITLYAQWWAVAETTKPLSFGTDCKVTIKSNEKFIETEWDTLVGKVEDAIMRGYNKGGAGFEAMFASSQNTRVILGSGFEHNWEVKDGEFRTVYVKIGSIGTVDFANIVMSMEMEWPYFE